MKTKYTFLNLITIMLLLSCSTEDEKILNKTISKLKSIETIEYDSSSKLTTIDGEVPNQELNYKMYFDFTSTDSLINTKYLFKTKTGEVLYDGKKQYLKDYQLECVLTYNSPNKDNHHSISGMNESLYEVKNILPKMLLDSTILHYRKNDTIIDEIDCYKFNFVIPNRNVMVDFVKVNDTIKDYFQNYTITISKNNYLPKLIQKSFGNSGNYRTISFNNLKFDSNRDLSTELKRIEKELPLVDIADLDRFLKENFAKNKDKKAIDFQLKSIEGKTISLSDFKDKFVLLEFWFPGCKGCVLAIPELNQIQEKYKKDGLVILGIEFTNESEKSLRKYIKKHNINIITLINGEEIAKKYNVPGAPTFFLINRNGEIVFSTDGYPLNELIREIEKNLKG